MHKYIQIKTCYKKQSTLKQETLTDLVVQFKMTILVLRQAAQERLQSLNDAICNCPPTKSDILTILELVKGNSMKNNKFMNALQ